MKYTIIATVCFVFMLFFALPSALALQTVALHPLKGDSPEVAGKFFDEIVKALSEFPGPYIPYLINLEDDETVDVTSGGLPAYICPQPILTKDAPYAITGEVIQISDSYYTIRLYLWDMNPRVALVSDELIIDADEDEVKYLTQLLAWMLSWIDREKPITPKTVAEQEEYWLFFGLKAGGGDSSWYFNTLDQNFIKREYVTHFLNGSFGLQGSVHFLRWLAFQAEVNFCVDFSQPWNTDATEGSFSSSYLTIPLMFRLNWRSEKLMASIYPGVYFYLPLFKTENEKLGGRFDYKPNQPGFFFGGNIGWKVGPGFLFVDGRFEYDGYFWNPPPSDRSFYRNLVRLSIGYEMGFLKKKKAQAEEPVNWAKVIPVAAEEEQEQEQLSSEEELSEQTEASEQGIDQNSNL
jgi:hypothetical protein